jgi:signal transduction histidine kinase
VNNVDKKIVAIFDPILLKTIVRNLLINAVKYSYSQSTIEIESKVVDSNTVEVCVIDHGVGMTQKQIESLFRIDVKQSTPGTFAEAGTGLGLHLCKEFLQKQGGTIVATSEPGAGSVFTFTLPISAPGSPKSDDNELLEAERAN